MEREIVAVSGSSEDNDSCSSKEELTKRKRRVCSLQISMTMEESTSNSESDDESSKSPPQKKLRDRIRISYHDQAAGIADVVSGSEDSVQLVDDSPAKKKAVKKKASDSDDEYVPEEKPAAKRRKLAIEKDKNVKMQTKVKAVRKVVVKKEKVVVKKDKIAKPKTERKPRSPRKPKTEATSSNSVEQQGVSPEASTSKEVKVKPEMHAKMDWDEAEYLAELQRLEFWVAANVKKLFDEDNTIPFIARYRKEMTNDMSPEKLRLVKESYEMIRTVKHKAAVTMHNIQKLGKLTPDVERSLRCARTLSEIEHINAPFKAGGKRTLAERARELGLEPVAIAMLEGQGFVILDHYVKPSQKGLESLENVKQGIMHIMADVISKDKLVLEQVRRLKDEATNIELETSKAKTVKAAEKKRKKEDDKSLIKVEQPGNGPVKKKVKEKSREEEEYKFQSYFTFKMRVRHLRPHQVLAINRGESLKILSVKIVIPDWLSSKLCGFCFRQWFSRGVKYPLRQQLLNESIQDSYARLLQPLLVRQVRADLNQEAERAGIEVFAANLKQLLLQHPLKGKTILGIDPGFRMGCKLGMISSTGEVLTTDVIYPHSSKTLEPQYNPSACTLKELLHKYSCELVALGNGTACRETEDFLSSLIQCGWFEPLDVTYTIVSEQGASIYSCSPVAKKEFPSMDPNLISAVSLARRVQDPLAELVKVEPKHLGVGMYQHDVSAKQLSATLDEVVMECVSFVGVDINTASEILLRRIAGLNALRATKIVEWRLQHGPFHNRQQIKKVKGIGEKSYEQCAGFVRVLPETWNSVNHSSTDSKNTAADINPLDRTWIHPESYSTAMRFISLCGADVADVGKPHFISNVQRTVHERGLSRLATELGVQELLVKLISDGLQQPPGYDIRADGKPLFRKGVTSLADLRDGTILTGRVQNVTHFGSFVDIGVGTNGLIPISQLRGISPPLGSHVEVRVMSVNIPQKRVSLTLIRVLT